MNSLPTSNKYFNVFGKSSVWTMDNDFFICKDQNTGQEVRRVARPVDENNVPIRVLESFNAWTNQDLILDTDYCSMKVYSITQATSEAAKRLLPAGSSVELKFTPNIYVWSDDFKVSFEHPGQEGWVSGLPLTLFSMKDPNIKAKKNKL